MLPAIAPTASATAAAHVHLCGAAGCGEAGEDKVSVDVSGTAEAPSPRSRPSGGRSKEKRVETGGGCRCGRAELLGLCSYMYGYPFLQSVFSSAPPPLLFLYGLSAPSFPTHSRSPPPPPRALCHAITHVGSAFSLFPFSIYTCSLSLLARRRRSLYSSGPQTPSSTCRVPARAPCAAL